MINYSKISDGFQLSFMAGTLTSYNVWDGRTTENVELDKDSYEGLSRIDFSIGLRFN